MSLSLMRLSDRSARPGGGCCRGSCLLPPGGQPLLCVLLLRLHSSESRELPLPGSPGHSLLEEFLRTFKDLEEAAMRKVRFPLMIEKQAPQCISFAMYVLRCNILIQISSSHFYDQLSWNLGKNMQILQVWTFFTMFI